jgi:hypothetical protein
MPTSYALSAAAKGHVMVTSASAAPMVYICAFDTIFDNHE